MPEATTALVLVSHSAALAAGTAEVAAQMAPDVAIRAAGGTDDGPIGTSYDLVERAVTGLLDEGAGAVVLLTDLGSAALTAESVLEMADDDRLFLADAPFVEGAVAAAVTAQGGADGRAVHAAAEEAGTTFGPADREDASDAASGAAPAEPAESSPAEHARTLVLRNRLGLHARPAAMLARKVGEFDAEVRLNGIDAASILAIMGLGLTAGAELRVEATGPQAIEALDAIEADVAAGFGEE
ncbi:dihydroxyacetone kinase phosphoryl donor subunit DhaM [Ruania halotolerans]|uniref:dihydroxyacetone kinase phosphoryl donor subunit DhaM n=1 Tax=Ruania halotolerans TaxID=2897773 RepID=UPI001E5A5DE0|nr:dihydroxyacetone kinase phosphoryl donor subunit DhaM [Ruania halotolerans]UFU05241.1 PTS-dependent dihydroxyacetone kinase phosphotransferase subunit DhaM [Ruania halotolerans]